MLLSACLHAHLAVDTSTLPRCWYADCAEPATRSMESTPLRRALGQQQRSHPRYLEAPECTGQLRERKGAKSGGGAASLGGQDTAQAAQHAEEEQVGGGLGGCTGSAGYVPLLRRDVCDTETLEDIRTLTLLLILSPLTSSSPYKAAFLEQHIPGVALALKVRMSAYVRVFFANLDTRASIKTRLALSNMYLKSSGRAFGATRRSSGR